MYARYTYLQGATTANILADVCAILCGITDKSALSAACDQVNTEILFSLNPATWVMHDNAATATGKVLKQRAADDSCDKFMHLNSTGNGNFTIGFSETWNATTHTGTYNGTGATGFDTSIGTSTSMASTSSFNPTGAPGIIHLYSDPYVTTGSFKSASWGYSYLWNIEFSRSGPLMLLANGYPNWGGGGNNIGQFKRPRIKNPNANGDSSCTTSLCGMGGMMYGYGGNGQRLLTYGYRNKNETKSYKIFQVADIALFTSEFDNPSPTCFDFLGFCLSPLKGVAIELGAAFDEILIEGVTHVKDGATNIDMFGQVLNLLYPKG